MKSFIHIVSIINNLNVEEAKELGGYSVVFAKEAPSLSVIVLCSRQSSELSLFSFFFLFLFLSFLF